MPEGDSLYRAAAALRPVLAGRPLDAVLEHGVPRRAFAGARVRAVESRGKHLLIEVEEVGTIHLHFRMNGRMWIDRRALVPAGRLRAASLALLAGEAAVLFTKTPVVEFLRTAFVHAHPALARLGPDLLGVPAADELDFDRILRRARAPELQDIAVAEVLLDQRVAAGIGNVYKSEVLFLERVDPFVPLRDLDDATLVRLYRTAARLLRMNLGPGRRTTTADRSRGERPPEGLGRYFVYDRRGRACPTCGEIVRARLLGDAGRNTFYCPRCQGVADPDPPPAPGERVLPAPDDDE